MSQKREWKALNVEPREEIIKIVVNKAHEKTF
jgi:hypothetical protein